MDRLDTLLVNHPSKKKDEGGWTLWQVLKEEPGKAGLPSVKEAAWRLRLLRKVALPVELFKDVSPRLIEGYVKRGFGREALRVSSSEVSAMIEGVLRHC